MEIEILKLVSYKTNINLVIGLLSLFVFIILTYIIIIVTFVPSVFWYCQQGRVMYLLYYNNFNVFQI